MVTVLRRVLLLLLVLALPLQGWAAATMRHCAPAQHQAAAGLGVHAEASVHDASPSAHSDPASGGAAEADLETMAECHTVVAAAGHADHDVQGKCSACAVCCASAALPSSPLIVDTRTTLPSYGAPLVEPDICFEQSGLERPPRALVN